MSSMHNGNVAVVGAAETTGLGTLPGMSTPAWLRPTSTESRPPARCRWRSRTTWA